MFVATLSKEPQAFCTLHCRRQFCYDNSLMKFCLLVFEKFTAKILATATVEVLTMASLGNVTQTETILFVLVPDKAKASAISVFATAYRRCKCHIGLRSKKASFLKDVKFNQFLNPLVTTKKPRCCQV